MSEPIAQVPPVEALHIGAPPVEAAHKPETFAERFARLRASIPRQSSVFVDRSSRAPKPLSNTSKKSIEASNNLRRKMFIKDLQNEKTLLNEASYIIVLYSGSYNKQLRIGDDTKIYDIINALQNFKSKNKTTKYDEMIKELQEIRKIHSIKEGGKRCKTRRKRRRTTRSSK